MQSYFFNLIVTLHVSQYQKYNCEDRAPSDICLEVSLKVSGLSVVYSGVWTELCIFGGGGRFVTAAQQILIVSSHDAQNFRAVWNCQHLRIILPHLVRSLYLYSPSATSDITTVSIEINFFGLTCYVTSVVSLRIYPNNCLSVLIMPLYSDPF